MSIRDEPPDDPFEGWAFDETWASRAAVSEASAHDRAIQAQADQHRSAAAAQAASGRRRAERWRHRRRRGLIVLVVLAFVGGVAIADRLDGDPEHTWTSGDAAAPVLTVGKHPPAAAAASTKPLGEPADPDADAGRYAFLQQQPGSNDPVTYDPCRPISVVVNARTAPPGGVKLVEEAVATLAEVTGLAIRVDGTTDERPRIGRPSYQPDRYGEHWAPVLVAWTDDGEIPDLGGDVAGLGGSIAVTPETGPATYVTGVVYLDGPDITSIIRDEDDGSRSARDVILHELGHLVGLAHVDDRSELMYFQGQPDLHGYQEGDKTGLTQLGQGTCVPRL